MVRFIICVEARRAWNSSDIVCSPQKKFALGGHSQGGFVTIQTIDALPASVLSRVVAVTMFGAPACPAKVSGKCISYCQAVCSAGFERLRLLTRM